MEKYLYSPSTNAFYPVSLKDHYEGFDSWPSDGVEVEENTFTAFSSTPPSGKVRVADDKGNPCWADAPPLTEDEIIAMAASKKSALRSEADAIIAPLADALAGGYIDDADKPRLTAWQKYRYALTKVDPSKPVWPGKPAG